MLTDSRTVTFPGPRLGDTGVQPSRDHDLPEGTALDFEESIQQLAAGVTVVATGDDRGEWAGSTTTEVCMLSVDPPTLIVCVRRNSPLGRQLTRTQRFCVNLLSHQQRDVAEAFDGGQPDCFDRGQWEAGGTGSPVLTDALASFECGVDLLYAYPHHQVVLGGVRSVTRGNAAGSPLMRISGRITESLLPGSVPAFAG